MENLLLDTKRFDVLWDRDDVFFYVKSIINDRYDYMDFREFQIDSYVDFFINLFNESGKILNKECIVSLIYYTEIDNLGLITIKERFSDSYENEIERIMKCV